MNKILLIIAFLLTAQSAQAASLSKPPNNLGLVAYWSFNEGTGLKAGDFSGRGGHGTLTNGPTWTSGKLGGALQFDGTDDYVATSKTLNSLISASTGTMSLWVKPIGASPTGGAPYQVQGIISDVLAYQGIYRGVIGGVDRIWIYNWDGSSDSVGVPYTTNEWIHVVWVHSGGNLYAYANGVFVGSTASGNTSDLTQIVNIGLGYQAFPDFAGSLDEIRVYNRALGANDVARLYATTQATVKGSGSADGLVGYWSLNDCQRTRATDQSGRGNHGTLNGFSFTGTSSNWVTGDNAKDLCAVAFDGFDDYVDTGDSSALEPASTITLAAWVKVAGAGTWTGQDNTNDFIISKGHSGNPPYMSYGLSWRPSSSLFGFTTSAGGTSATLFGVTARPANTGWHHVVGVYDGVTAKIYVNGVQEASTAMTGNFSYGLSVADGLYIGKWDLGTGEYKRALNGSIDEVRIYNRALTAEQVKALYTGNTRKTQVSSNKLTQGTSLATGLVGHWTFDGAHMTGSGGVGTAKDVSGNNNHGALTNNPMRALGKMGQALSFDGVDDYVTMGNATALQFERTNSFSMSVWVKTTTATMSSNAAIIGKAYSTAPYSGYGLVIRGDTVGDPYQFGLVNDAFSGNSIIVHVPRPANTSWQHLVATYNGTSLASGVNIYVDGVLQSNTPIGDNLSSSILTSAHFNVGALDNSSTFIFNSGSIDEVRVYNRVLSATEVKTLYNLAR